MKQDPIVQKDAKAWIFRAGAAAILLCIFLFMSDEYLSNSPREKELGRTLFELRSAQTSLSSGVTDTRQTTPFLVQKPEIHAQESEKNSEEHSH